MIRRTRAGDRIPAAPGCHDGRVAAQARAINERRLIEFTLPAALVLVRIRHPDDR
jgi:hypothetical protein